MLFAETRQLVLRPSSIAIGPDLAFVRGSTFATASADAVAALFIDLCQQNGDKWYGFALDELKIQVGLLRKCDTPNVFKNKSIQFYSGLAELAIIEALQSGKSFDSIPGVIYPTEALVKPFL